MEKRKALAFKAFEALKDKAAKRKVEEKKYADYCKWALAELNRKSDLWDNSNKPPKDEGISMNPKVTAKTDTEEDSALREFNGEMSDVTDNCKNQGHTMKSVEEVNKCSNPEVSEKQNKSVQHEKTSKRNFLKKKMATEGPYACSKCFKRYRNKEKFVIHFKNFHMDHSDSEEIKHFREAIKKQKIV